MSRQNIYALIAASITLFWLGSFFFGLPGVMASYWMDQLQAEKSQIGQVQAWILLALGLFMYVAGRAQERFKPGSMILTGVLLMSLNTFWLGSYTSIAGVKLWAFLIGVSAAFLYIPCMTLIQLWFPHKRGLVSGVANMVFGISAFFMSPLFSKLLLDLGALSTCRILGVISLLTGLLLLPFLKNPPPGYTQKKAGYRQGSLEQAYLTPKQSLKTFNFWIIWCCWVLAGGSGFAMITFSTMFGRHMGLELNKAVLLLSLFGLANGLSRLLSGWLSDALGRSKTMSLAFFFGGLAYIFMPHVNGLVLWAFLAAMVGFSFGTLFAVSVPLVSDCFGLKHFGAILGLIFTAYGFLAGPLGPWLAGYLLQNNPGNFVLVFGYLGTNLIIAALIILMIKEKGKESIA